jgi:hypothetical protein
MHILSFGPLRHKGPRCRGRNLPVTHHDRWTCRLSPRRPGGRAAGAAVPRLELRGRETGALKRRRATPVRPLVLIGAT